MPLSLDLQSEPSDIGTSLCVSGAGDGEAEKGEAPYLFHTQFISRGIGELGV